MVTFTCPQCGKERTGARRRCYECTKTRQTPESIEKTRQGLLGRTQSDEHRRKNSDGHKGNVNRFNLADFMHGKPAHNRLPAGSERKQNGHTMVKCPDGKWRYKARLMWVAAGRKLPRGMIVHHVNGDPFDDRLDNFQLVNRAEHMKIHNPRPHQH